MQKFFAVLKREYKKVVFTWTFVITTLLLPLIAALSFVLPMLIFTIEGDSTRIAVADPTGKIYERLRDNLSSEKIMERAKKAAEDSLKNIDPSQEAQLKRASEQLGGNFTFVEYNAAGKDPEQIKNELNARVTAKQLDAYLLIPNDLDGKDAEIELYSRKAGDFIVNSTLEDAVNSAVRSQRLADANISEEALNLLSRKVGFVKKSITETGKEKEDATSPWAGFIVALLIYVVLLVYGQSIMSAIVEEKETKISEILFSSARPFELLMGKLVGVGLAGLTQLSIWIVSVLVLLAFGLASLVASGIEIEMPYITPPMIVYFFIFFLLGYFIYATIYALIGSMVTNMQEGSQFALPPVLVLMLGLYFCFAVVRDPNSTLAFWVSIAPFFAPIVMPVRILAEIPPFWQIALAIILNIVTILGLTWVASRVYRVGMLMYGKRATIPEVWKWIRHS
ncbi:MAG: ABC transporter permease [Pyrinomonadaceae bacterium]